jgi:hypothetical protein
MSYKKKQQYYITRRSEHHHTNKPWTETKRTQPAHHQPQPDGRGDQNKLLKLVLTVYFGTPSMFITLWFGFDYGTNPPLGTLII